MILKKYDDPKEFYDQIGNFLYERELENNLLIGIAENIQHRENLGDILLCAVFEKRQPVLVAMMTPPWPLLLNSANVNKESLGFLIEKLQNDDISFSGFLAEKKIAELFESSWLDAGNTKLKLFRNERIYKLTRCKEINLSTGKIRKAGEDDVGLITNWTISFQKEIQEETDYDHARKMVIDRLNHIHVWLDAEPVSMCCSARETRNSRIINMVYTPPDKRGKGYASSLVHGCCKGILENEKQFCGLFTDLSNPVSNSIYRKIGFEPVMDLVQYKLER